jgi:hypothetical protein
MLLILPTSARRKSFVLGICPGEMDDGSRGGAAECVGELRVLHHRHQPQLEQIERQRRSST